MMRKPLENDKNYQSNAELKGFPPRSGACGDWGLSGFLTVEALEVARANLILAFPQFAKHPVMQLMLEREDGVILRTPTPEAPDHHDLWPYEGVDLKSKSRRVT